MSFLLSEARSTACTPAQLASLLAPWIGPPMAKSWPLRRLMRTGSTPGFHCFRSPIPPHNDLPHSDQEQDCSPAFSPDGGTVAFVRGITPGVVSDVYVVPTSGGEPRRVTQDNTWIMGAPAWTPDGRDIVFSSTRAGLASLWRVSASGGTPRPVVGVGLNASYPSVSRKDHQLVYQQRNFKNNVWLLDLSDEKTRRGPPSIVISDKGPELARPHFSPDGKRMACESDRLGYAELWTCDSDGSNCSQLTSLHGTAGAATWSPDGRQIAFEFRPKQHSEVYVAEVGGGQPRLLETFQGSDNGR